MHWVWMSEWQLKPTTCHAPFIRYRVVWCAVVWCGVMWCDVVWCGQRWMIIRMNTCSRINTSFKNRAHSQPLYATRQSRVLYSINCAAADTLVSNNVWQCVYLNSNQESIFLVLSLSSLKHNSDKKLMTVLRFTRMEPRLVVWPPEGTKPFHREGVELKILPWASIR